MRPAGRAGRRFLAPGGHLLGLAVIFAVTVVVYSRSFSGEFQFDDYQIVDNPIIHHPNLYGLLEWARTRILPLLTFLLNYQLSGARPFSYHVLNFSIHLLATFAVFQLALALCRTPRLRDTELGRRSATFALSAAFLFACHPLQIQAVTYVAQRISSMAALFYVGSILFYVRARNRQRNPGAIASYVASLALALAALLSKENAATLPVMILLAEVVFFGRKGMGGTALRLMPFALLVLAIPVIWEILPGLHQLPTGGEDLPWLERQFSRLTSILSQPAESAQVSPLSYFFTQCVVIPRYVRMVLLPYGFNVDHDVPLEAHVNGNVMGGFVFLAALFGLGAFAVRRRPMIGFGILWFFLALSIESSFIPIRDPMNEHRMYLAMPGVSFVLASIFVEATLRWAALAWAVGVAFAGLLCITTFIRNEVWRTQRALWEDALQKSPGKARVHVNYGTALHLDGELDEAIEHYCRALEIEPGNRRARSNINIAQQEQVDRGEAVLEVQVQPDGTVIGVAVDPCPAAETKNRD